MAVKVAFGAVQVNTIAVVGVIPANGAVFSSVITTLAVEVQPLAPVTVTV